ncbi:MAG: Ger(x)C family spore germination protein [Cellulosilyticaceae bacterium]
MKIHKWIKLAPLLLGPLILTGCWDSMEINSRSVILELGIDKNEEESNLPLNQKARVSVTYSIPDMAKMSGSDSLRKDVEATINVKAPTLIDSIERLETQTQNTITFSHVKGILLGEALLKDSDLLKEVLDGAGRNMMLARNIPLLAVKGPSEEALQVQNKEQPILGLYIMRFFNNNERPRSSYMPQLLGNFIREMEDIGVATIPIFHGSEDGEINISGGAVMKEYGLVDYITKEQVKGLLYITGEIKNAPVLIQYKNEYLTFNVKTGKSKMSFKNEKGTMVCYIKLDVEGDIVEYASSETRNLFSKGDMSEVENLLKGQIVEEAKIALDKAKAINVDFLGIGRELYRKEPQYWKSFGDEWGDSVFQKMPIVIEGNVRIRNTGALQ